MSWLAFPLLVSVIIAVVAVLVCLLFVQVKNLRKRIEHLAMQNDASEMLVSDLQIQLNVAEQKITQTNAQVEAKSLEDTQVSKQIEHRIKTLQSRLTQVIESVDLLSEQQPQDKLYSRASKLAALGADTEEIMRECELPRAEVEMLLSVYKSTQNK